MVNFFNKEEMEVNTAKVRNYFYDYLNKIKYKGIFGVASFSVVYNNLMPIQQIKLKEILEANFNDFVKTGSIISLGIFYYPQIIDCINVKKNGDIDKKLWNHYSDEYKHLNELLKVIANKIAELFNGMAIPPTTETPSDHVKNVKDYFPKTISHRIVAEFAGVGWRGKNELIITEKQGPAIRFASVLINIPLNQGKQMENKCYSCTACLEVCPFLRNKDSLEDYRENCRKYIISLGLNHDVCGKCIKACYEKFYSRL
ncbi:MAG: hypothetical protein ACFFAT_12885 [Promethearchaeota archaeon]